jgi:hypothetical protein
MNRMSKEATVAQFEVLSWNLFGGTEENHDETANKTVVVPADIPTGNIVNRRS